MDNELRRKLQDCLREVESTGDIEGALRRFPRDADALRPYLELATSLGSQIGGPAAADRLTGRQRLLSEIANLDQRKRGIGHMTIFGQRLLPIAGAVVGAVFMLGGMAGAAALPGSPVPAPQDALPFVHHSSGVQTASDENSDTEHEGCETAEANDDDANSEPREGDCATATPTPTPVATPAETPAASPEDQNDDHQGDSQGHDDANETEGEHEGDSQGIQPGATPEAEGEHETQSTPGTTQQSGDDHSGDSAGDHSSDGHD